MARPKKKDFQKQKLKVGKGKVAKTNATNTSFTAKSIALPDQGLGKDSNLTTHLNLTKHHTAIARKQAVIHLRENLHLHPTEAGTIVKSLAPLIVDTDRDVRQQVLKFVQALDQDELSTNARLILLYIQSAMTHITPSVRAESTRFLDALIAACPDQVARLGFAKTLGLFFALLGWPLEGQAQSGSVSAALAFGKSADKVKLAHLQSLFKLLEIGLVPDPKDSSVLFAEDTTKFMIPQLSDPYARLGLGSNVSSVTEDRDARLEVLETFLDPLKRGLAVATKEGGEIGRLASKISVLAS